MLSSYREDAFGAWAAWYGYDDGGNRAVKFSGECVTITQNGHTTLMVSLTNPVVYASPLVTLTKRGYTKHYFEGERRICSAIGGGFTHVEWDSIDASQDKVVAPICDELFPLLDDGVEEAMHCVELNDIHLSGRLIYRMLRLEATKSHDDPEPVYYYHNDHLGGTAYLTDQTGQVAQTLAYLPYGEDWVDVTTFQYDTSQIGFYQFNGKEKDPETDYLYYGARYYWPDACNGWLSPDPLMDDYPNISPYAYCNWNPVNLVDPDGKETDDWKLKNDGSLIWDKNTKGTPIDRIVAEDGSYVRVPNGVLLKDDQYGGANYGLSGSMKLSIDNKENAYEIFEFLADKSSVEFSLLGVSQTTETDVINNYELYSSMSPNSDTYGSSQSILLAKEGRLRKHIHNHPNGKLEPSNAINSSGDGDDYTFSKEIRTIINKGKFPSCDFYIYGSDRGGVYRQYGDKQLSGNRINSIIQKGKEYRTKK